MRLHRGVVDDGIEPAEFRQGGVDERVRTVLVEEVDLHGDVRHVGQRRRHRSVVQHQRGAGSGESIGLPELKPDTNVAITGLGRAFSKTYYLSEATHTIDNSGYRTSFKVRETTI